MEEQLCHLNTGAIVLSLQKPQVCPEIDSVPSQKNQGHAKSRDVRVSCTCQGSVIKPMGSKKLVGCQLAGPEAPMPGVRMSAQSIHWK